jgi:hypothetical protein
VPVSFRRNLIFRISSLPRLPSAAPARAAPKSEIRRDNVFSSSGHRLVGHEFAAGRHLDGRLQPI